MGLFKKRAADTAEMERLRTEVAAIVARLDAADHRLDAKDSEQAALGQRLHELVVRLDTPLAPPPEPPPLPPPTVGPAELAAVRERIEELAARLEGVDARITSISVELANQIDELSGELESRPTGTAAPADEVVDELRDAQTRLANEQARYQIAFRQDLADLADRLRRG